MMRIYNVGQKVQVDIKELTYGYENIDKQLQGATGKISEVSAKTYPYRLLLDDKVLDKLLTDTPRQFDNSELKLV